METLKNSVQKYRRRLFHLAIIALFISSCTKKNVSLPDGSKAIISFKIIKANGNLLDSSSIHATIDGDSVLVTVPQGTDLTSLTPLIEIEGVSVSPASGVTQNFSSPVAYTVKAADGTSKTYIVSVKWEIVHNLVFFGASNNTFYTLDAVDGNLLWKYTAGGGFSYSSPTVWKNIVFAGCTDNNMYAFDAATGQVLWTFTTGLSIESSPAVADGVLYFGSDDHYIYALDALTGQLKWKYQTGFNTSSSPTIVNGVVYTGSDDNNLYALDAQTGDLKWTFDANALFNASSPVVVNGVLFIGSRDGNLYAVDANSGMMKWKFDDGGISLEQSSATVFNGIVYIAGWYNISDFSVKGSLYAVNEQTGALLWTSLDSLAFSSSPVIASGNLYISADDLNFYSLDANNGNVNWKEQILPNGASPAVADGEVYVGGGGTGYFYALDAQSGNTKWKFAIPNGLTVSSPCIIGVDGTVYHPGVSGEEY